MQVMGASPPSEGERGGDCRDAAGLHDIEVTAPIQVHSGGHGCQGILIPRRLTISFLPRTGRNSQGT
jgi:hypothetical protein